LIREKKRRKEGATAHKRASEIRGKGEGETGEIERGGEKDRRVGRKGEMRRREGAKEEERHTSHRLPAPNVNDK
jgi:hypothetical protein